MNNDQNSADPGAGNAMAWRETSGTVQPDASFTLYDLELTNGNFHGDIQIAIPKPPSTDSIRTSSSHCENTNSERLHPSASTNATDLKRKRTGDDAARASKRAPPPTFPAVRIADLRGTLVHTEPETPPMENVEFLKWVRKQMAEYAPAISKQLLLAIDCLGITGAREFGFENASKILGRHLATLVEEAKEMKTVYDKVRNSGGPCVRSILETLEQATRQVDKRRDEFAERVRAFEAEAKA